MDLASALEPDGGMPGKDAESRAAATLAALLAFVSQGHTPTSGAFRSHVARLIKFLQLLKGFSHQLVVDTLVAKAQKGSAPQGDWLALARSSSNLWPQLEIAAKQ